MTRYFPFIIISLILYTLFFYYHKKSKLLSSSELIATAKVISLDLHKQTESKKLTSIESPIKPVAIVDLALMPTGMLITAQKHSPNRKIVDIQKRTEQLRQFKISIKTTLSSDVALLKGEFYERDFHLDLPAPPIKKKITFIGKNNIPKEIIGKLEKNNITKKFNITQFVASSDILNQKQIAIKKTKEIITLQSKPKRSFKKQLNAQQTAIIPGLQTAISISGNVPTYPKVAKQQGLQGTVTATFIVNMQGKSQNPKIISSSGHKILDKALLEFINKERFMPALKGIEKVTREQQFSFKYGDK